MHLAFKQHLPKSRPSMHFQVLKLLDDVMSKIIDDLKGKVEHLFTVNENPFTANHYLFECIQKKRLAPIKRRIVGLVNSCGEASVESLLPALEAIFDQVECISNEDHMAFDMQIMLDSYGKVASKRVIDEIPMLLQSASRQLVECIKDSLTLPDSTIKAWLRESQEIEGRRKQIQDEISTMEAALKAFEDLQAFE